jgi:hypothetical protein
VLYGEIDALIRRRRLAARHEHLPRFAQRPMIEYLDLPSGFSFTLAGVWSFDVLSQQPLTC